MNRLKTSLRVLARRLTWRNVKFLGKTSVQSWLLKLAAAAVIAGPGMCPLALVANVQLTTYAFWLMQLIAHGRSGE